MLSLGIQMSNTSLVKILCLKNIAVFTQPAETTTTPRTSKSTVGVYCLLSVPGSRNF